MPRFESELVAERGGVVAHVPGVREKLGGRRVPVVATINGHSWRTTTSVDGVVPMIVVNKSVRSTAGVSVGDVVSVAIELDEARREVEVPEALAAALANRRRGARGVPLARVLASEGVGGVGRGSEACGDWAACCPGAGDAAQAHDDQLSGLPIRSAR